MCIKFGLRKPIYSDNKLLVYDLENKEHYYSKKTVQDEEESDEPPEIAEDLEEQEKNRLIWGPKTDKDNEQLALDALNDWQNIAKVFLC